VQVGGTKFGQLETIPARATLATCQGFIIHLPSRKNDHVSGDIPIAFPHLIGLDIDPVQAILDAQKSKTAPKPADPVFPDRHNRPMSYDLFRRILAFATKSCKLKEHVYLPHRFRIGAATAGASLCFPAYIVKALGQWNSGCFNRYIRLTPSDRITWASRLASARVENWKAAARCIDNLEAAAAPANAD
jgi:hypothetical protein